MKGFGIARYILTLVGVALLAAAFLLYANARSFLAHASRMEGTVVDLIPQHSDNSTTYAPVVSFQPGPVRIQFRASWSSNPPRYHVGETVPVLYLPSDPYKAQIDSFFSIWGASIILGGMGALFLSIGGAMILVPLRQRRNDEHLLHEGVPIQADFQGVDINTSCSVNGRHPFRVLAQWQNPTTSRIHVFESHNIWFDPTRYIQQKEIRVFLERGNPKKYYVDLSFLPKLAD
jgi:hypothetical protein